MPHSELFRPRGGEAGGRVAFVELFFDLVFVLTIIQLSHTVVTHYTWLGVIESLLLVLAVWWVWIYTTWVTNWLDPNAMAVRALLFVMMFCGLVMAIAIPSAFAHRALAFAGAYVVMQVGQSIFTLVAVRGHHLGNYRNAVRITVWLVASGALWVGGAFAGEKLQLTLWLLALGIDYLAPLAGFWTPGLGRFTHADWDVRGAHMAERCALFVIVCLGEQVLVIGRQANGLEFDGAVAAAFAVTFGLTVALWWIYFRFGHGRAAQWIDEASSTDSEVKIAFTYAHIPLVIGMIFTAVASDFIITHPREVSDSASAAAILGGPATYLLGNIWFKSLAAGRWPLSHLGGLVGLALLTAGLGRLTHLGLGTSVLGVLMIVALWEYGSLRTLRLRKRT